MRKVNILITITKLWGKYIIFTKEIKINARKGIIIEGARALDPLKELNEINKLIND